MRDNTAVRDKTTRSPFKTSEGLRLLETESRRAHWRRGPGRPTLLDGVTAALTVARDRLGVSGRRLTMRHACA